MRRWATLVIGLVIGQWLAFAGLPSPADFYAGGRVAWERQDFTLALQLWSRAAAAQPENPLFHYLRATALERLGQRDSAADAYRLALLLEPPPPVARMAETGLANVEAPGGAPRQTEVPLEAARGVWLAAVRVNGGEPARFLVDTGSSVTLVSPALAAAANVRAVRAADSIELQTLAGRAVAPTAVVASLRIGDSEVQDVPVVVHDPGTGVDGILGNTVLGRYRVTVDAVRRVLRLAPPGTE